MLPTTITLSGSRDDDCKRNHTYSLRIFSSHPTVRNVAGVGLTNSMDEPSHGSGGCSIIDHSLSSSNDEKLSISLENKLRRPSSLAQPDQASMPQS